MHRTSLAVAFSLIAVSMISPAGVYAAPLFYLSDQPLGIAQPGMFSLNNPVSGATGQLNIYAMTDVRLSGVSLDLSTTGGGIKFSGLNVVNDGRWWILDGPQMIEDSKIKSIGGGAIPGMSGNGIGPSDFVDASFHTTSGYLMATVDYEVVDASLSSNFELKVGYNTIADWQGDSPMVHFNDYSQPAVSGTHPGLPPLSNPPPPPQQPTAPEPILDPVEPQPLPEISDPQPQPAPLNPDATMVDSVTDIPRRWHDGYREFILPPFGGFPMDDFWRAEIETPVDIIDPADYEPLDFSHINIMVISDHEVHLHKVSDDAALDNSILVASSLDGRVWKSPPGLDLNQFNGPSEVEHLFGTTAFTINSTTTAEDAPLTASVPEPAVVALVALALVAIAGLRWDRRS